MKTIIVIIILIVTMLVVITFIRTGMPFASAPIEIIGAEAEAGAKNIGLSATMDKLLGESCELDKWCCAAPKIAFTYSYGTGSKFLCNSNCHVPCICKSGTCPSCALGTNPYCACGTGCGTDADGNSVSCTGDCSCTRLECSY